LRDLVERLKSSWKVLSFQETGRFQVKQRTVPGDIAISEPNQTNDFFETLARVLLRCWILGFIVLLFWWGAITLADDLTLGVHGDMFGLTRPQFNVIHYCGILLTKLVVAVFFFIPWVSIWNDRSAPAASPAIRGSTSPPLIRFLRPQL